MDLALPGSERCAGILHPIFSLHQPGFGQAALDFIDFVADSGLKVWQILPLNPAGQGGSPYNSCSSFAIDPRWLDEDILSQRTDFKANTPAAQRRYGVGADSACRQRFARFIVEQHHWLVDYACFVVAHEYYQSAWQQWPEGLRARRPAALADFKRDFAVQIDAVCFEQFLLDEQWHSIRRAANAKGVLILGDLPIFVAADSADVWANQSQFELDSHGNPQRVAGVPPDYFSQTGQRWGNPLYRYDLMAADGYTWWQQRFARQVALYDWVRIDHFRGLVAYWAIDQSAPTAMEGRWIDGPKDDLLEALKAGVGGYLPVVAEDLGIITQEVTDLKDRFDLPGMLIMQFAFEGGLENNYHPENHCRQAVVYTGTHDNNTTLGWWQELSGNEQAHVRKVLEQTQGIPNDMPMPEALIHSAMKSVASVAIIPAADWLALDGSARINTPGTVENNWSWRAPEGVFDAKLAKSIRSLCQQYRR